MSSQVQPIGVTPSVFRLVSPVNVVDATGGVVEVDANTKFNTNIPFSQYMLITEVDWYVNVVKQVVPQGAKNFNWQSQAQITEALARTAVSLTDPVYVDNFIEEDQGHAVAITAASEIFGQTKTNTIYRHVLANPWATSAQQLNLVSSVKVAPAGDNDASINGPKVNYAAIMEYQLLPLSQSVAAYLATRIQIAGQA